MKTLLRMSLSEMFKNALFEQATRIGIIDTMGNPIHSSNHHSSLSIWKQDKDVH